MISVLLPTRNRPIQLARMIQSIRETAYQFPEIVVYIDDDCLAISSLLDVKCIVGPRLIFTDYWNKCYQNATGDILMMASDDLIFCTPNWDVMVEKAFQSYPDRIVMVYGNDKSCVPSNPFVSRNWCEAVGYFSPPYFECGSCDYWLNDVAKFIERKHHVPLILKQHPVVDKQEEARRALDVESKRSRTKALYDRMFEERFEDASKLQAIINNCQEICSL